MNAARLVPLPGYGWRAHQLTVTIALPPEQACEQVLEGLLRRRHARVVKRSSLSVRLRMGSWWRLYLSPFSDVLAYAQARLGVPTAHLGLVCERVDVEARATSTVGVSTVTLRPVATSSYEVCVVLADDLEPAAEALQASGQLVAVGQWERVDHQEAARRAREQRRTRRA